MAPNDARSRCKDRVIAIVLAVLATVLVFSLTVPDDIFTPDAQKIGAAAMAQPDPVKRLIKLVLLLAGLAVIMGRLADARRLLRHTNRFFLIFLILVPLSYLWSISRADTLARFVAIASIVSIATAVCLTNWQPKRFQNVVRPIVTLLLAGSVLLYFSNPDLATEHAGELKGAWHGLASQKNIFGMIAGMGVVLWLHALLAREAGLLRSLAGLGLAGTCLVLSRSSTSMLATVLSCFLVLLCGRAPPWLRRYMPYLVAGFVMLVLVYALTILRLVPGLDILLVPVTHLTGKDTTFSNRSEIWKIIQDHIQLAPLLGSGYGAYWVGPLQTSPSYIFMTQMWFYPTESHNGYLEITNDLGFVGLTVLFGYLIQFTRSALQVLRVDRAQGALFLGLFFQQAIINLSESCWLEINSGPILPIMTLATMALARTLQLQDRAARAQRQTAWYAAAQRSQPAGPPAGR
jgi:exopolysaccharide production protein ExoQ